MTESPSIPATIDAAKMYDVKLARPIIIFGTKLLPLHDHQIVGSALTRIIKEQGADAIYTATPVVGQ